MRVAGSSETCTGIMVRLRAALVALHAYYLDHGARWVWKRPRLGGSPVVRAHVLAGRKVGLVQAPEAHKHPHCDAIASAIPVSVLERRRHRSGPGDS